jgi:hypothetical protein
MSGQCLKRSHIAATTQSWQVGPDWPSKIGYTYTDPVIQCRFLAQFNVSQSGGMCARVRIDKEMIGKVDVDIERVMQSSFYTRCKTCYTKSISHLLYTFHDEHVVTNHTRNSHDAHQVIWVPSSICHPCIM